MTLSDRQLDDIEREASGCASAADPSRATILLLVAELRAARRVLAERDAARPMFRSDASGKGPRRAWRTP